MNISIETTTGVYLSQIALSAFFAILFLQSGLDKLMNFKENLSWLVGHFSKTFFSGFVPLLLIALTLSEILAGLSSGYGLVELVLHKNPNVSFWGMALSALSLLFLFLGQRIAKDYSGAGGLVAYLIAAVVGLILLG
jgi:hypothetical protein